MPEKLEPVLHAPDKPPPRTTTTTSATANTRKPRTVTVPESTGNVKVKTTLEYDADMNNEEKLKRPVPPPPDILNQMNQMNGINGRGNNFGGNQFSGNSGSDNAVQDFLDDCEGEEDIYVRLVRLPDNPLANEQFNKPCSYATNFNPFPLNRKAFIADIQKINGNSGGRFKATAMDEEMNDIGIVMRTTVIANPYNANANTNGNGNNSDLQQILNAMQESNRQLIEAIAVNNNNAKPQESEIAQLGRELLLKKLADIDKPQGNGGSGLSDLTGLSPDAQMLALAMRNPQAAREMKSTTQNFISSIFSSEEKNEVKEVARTWGDKIVNAAIETWNTDKDVRMQTMGIANKALDLIGFGVSKIKGKTPPTRNPNRTENTQQQQPANAMPEVEEEYTDAEILEYEAEQDAILNSDIVQKALAYIDSDEPLTVDNEFMAEAKKASSKMTWEMTMVFVKNSPFKDVYDRLLNEYPFIETLIIDKPRRMERLKEFHALLAE